MNRILVGAAALAALAYPAAAFAQNDGAQAETVFDGDYLTVGIGAGYGPSYEGSDDYVLFPAPVVQGNLSGIAITPRPGGIALDFIPDAKDAKVGFSFGPVVRLRSNRTGHIKDDVVKRLGELDTAVEVGANAGITVYDLLSGYDSLTFSSDVRWDVASAHEGMVIAPSVSYFTPVSRGAAVSLSLGAEHVDDDYADYYFSVSPAGTAASGLPTFQADGGWKSVGANLLVGVDFDGELANGGLAGFVLGGYTRLLGDAKRTPLTSIRGDADQWTIGAGLAFTF
ncbi:MAG TPA: MipA/OmpV family protein [Novosphingobium sp.]|nr:MipA/OmpV family protein [Novosphingobium sp.]